MADIGYSRKYLILLTRRNGVKTITNPLSIEVYHTLLQRELSASEVARVLGRSQTSVNSAVKVLHADGILSERPDENDARAILYRADAQPVLLDALDVSFEFDNIEKAVDSIINDEDRKDITYLSIICSSFFACGIDLWALLVEYGVAIGVRSMKGDKPMTMVGLKRVVTGLAPGMDVEFDIKNGLVINAVSDESLIFTTPLLAIVMGFLRAISPGMTGRNYVPMVNIGKKNGGRILRLSSSLFEGGLYEEGLPDIPDRPIEFFRVSQPLAIYEIEGSHYLFTNKVMISILGCLNESSMSVNQLSETLVMPAVTVYKALDRLLAIGAVDFTGMAKTKTRIFQIKCKRSLSMKEPIDGRAKMNHALQCAQESYDSVLSTFLEYFSGIMETMGFSFDEILSEMGKKVGRVIVRKYAQDFEQSIGLMRHFMGPSDEIVITSERVIDIRMSDMGQANNHSKTLFLDAMVKAVAHKYRKGAVRYTIRSSIIPAAHLDNCLDDVEY